MEMSPSRRKFVFGTIGAFVTATGGYLLWGQRRVWITVGPLSSIPEKGVLRFTHEEDAIFVRRLPSGSLLAISRKCTHQGCMVGWDPAADEYKCPCHLGTFSPAGEVLAGVPVRPLDTFATRIEAGTVQVLI